MCSASIPGWIKVLECEASCQRSGGVPTSGVPIRIRGPRISTGNSCIIGMGENRKGGWAVSLTEIQVVEDADGDACAGFWRCDHVLLWRCITWCFVVGVAMRMNVSKLILSSGGRCRASMLKGSWHLLYHVVFCCGCCYEKERVIAYSFIWRQVPC